MKVLLIERVAESVREAIYAAQGCFNTGHAGHQNLQHSVWRHPRKLQGQFCSFSLNPLKNKWEEHYPSWTLLRFQKTAFNVKKIEDLLNLSFALPPAETAKLSPCQWHVTLDERFNWSPSFLQTAPWKPLTETCTSCAQMRLMWKITPETLHLNYAES